MKDHLIGRTETKGITTMNESETIAPRELNPLALAFVGGALKYYLDYYYYSRWLKIFGYLILDYG